MKLYFATKPGKDFSTIYQFSNRFLFAFSELNTNISPYQYPIDLFLDSGAFAAWKSGKIISITDYMDYITMYQIPIYANMDVIGNPDGSWNNYNLMRHEGMNPIPVFHIGSDYNYLVRYCEMADYIALGGMVGRSYNQKIEFLSRSFSIISKFDNKRIHGFGCFDFRLLMEYPFYSVDSTAWNIGRKFGQSNIITPDKQYKRRSIYKMSNDRDQVRYIKSSDYRIEVSIKSFIGVEKYITELWENRGIIYE